MNDSPVTLPIADVILDDEIYPRSTIDHKRVAMFAENIRDGFEFDPIHVQELTEEKGKYRILDGAHRWQAHKSTGAAEISAKIIKLNGDDPLLYAAKQAIGPRQLNDAEAKDTARRAYRNNPRISSAEIGKSIGRSRQSVDTYIADLRAVIQFDIALKVFRLTRLGIPQQRMAARLYVPQQSISDYLPKMPDIAFSVNSDLKRGFTVSQVAEKHGWPESMVWALKLEQEDDLGKCHGLHWGIRTWDNWYWNDCDKRFGDEWPGRIPAQLIAHILFFFSSQNDLVLDPMAGGGVTADTCLALNRRCWSFDMVDRPDTRPEIEPYFWDMKDLRWPVNGKTRPDLIIFDPPYFSKSERFQANMVAAMQQKKILGVTSRYVVMARICD